jgi:hypothetical protein
MRERRTVREKKGRIVHQKQQGRRHQSAASRFAITGGL